MVSIPPVGTRIVVRYLLPTGQATDALGVLMESAERMLVVDGKRGREEVPVGAIIAIKPVPPPPAPRARRAP